MAATLVNKSCSRLLSAGCKLGTARVTVVGAGHQIQVATLKATYGEPYPYPEPYPYWKKRYTMPWTELFDTTWSRFNENTKVILVEGNVAVGKKDFAERLAKAFDLKYFEPTPNDRHIFNKENGFDPRMLNDMLPADLRPYDLSRFLEDEHPKLGRVGRLQGRWYQEKFKDYCRALTHVLSTGQGVVCVRSHFSDHVFADAQRQMGYISRNYHKYYNQMYDNTHFEVLRPHVVIYLDAPVSTIKKRIQERNNPSEVNSKALNDEYLTMIERVYKEKYLPEMKRYGEIVEIDYSEKADDMDMDVIVEEIQRLHLNNEDSDDLKFREWDITEKDDWTMRRKNYQMDWFYRCLFNFLPPMGCPEVWGTQEDRDMYKKVVGNHPAMKWAGGWAKELGDETYFKF